MRLVLQYACDCRLPIIYVHSQNTDSFMNVRRSLSKSDCVPTGQICMVRFAKSVLSGA